MKTSMQPYKGARDFYPEDKRIQNWIFNTWRRVAEKYGYEEYDASIIEPLDLYRMKTSEEIVNEQVYSFVDRGGRDVTLRPEMTPTVSRMVAARRQELPLPIRWYSIPNVWRYERPQRGRLREHWQLNIDIFGVDSIEAELELFQIADDLLKAFHAKRKDYEFRINSREFIDMLLTGACKLSDEKAREVTRLVDRIHKMPTETFKAALLASTGSESKTELIMHLLEIKDISELPRDIQDHPSTQRISSVVSALHNLGITNARFDITLMRGFDYYTGVVFEVFDTDPENNRSLFGGGRYDGLVAKFGVDPLPTVGFGVGDVTFRDFLETHGLLKPLHSKTEAVIIHRSNIDASQARLVVRELRDMGVRVAADYTDRKIDKQYKAAVKSGVKYAIFIGNEEIESNLYILKNLTTGKEESHSLQRIVSIVKDTRLK